MSLRNQPSAYLQRRANSEPCARTRGAAPQIPGPFRRSAQTLSSPMPAFRFPGAGRRPPVSLPRAPSGGNRGSTPSPWGRRADPIFSAKFCKPTYAPFLCARHTPRGRRGWGRRLPAPRGQPQSGNPVRRCRTWARDHRRSRHNVACVACVRWQQPPIYKSNFSFLSRARERKIHKLHKLHFPAHLWQALMIAMASSHTESAGAGIGRRRGEYTLKKMHIVQDLACNKMHIVP